MCVCVYHMHVCWLFPKNKEKSISCLSTYQTYNKIWWIYCFVLVKHGSHPALSKTNSKISNCLALSHKPKPRYPCGLWCCWGTILGYGRWKIRDDRGPHIFGIELKARISPRTSLVGPSLASVKQTEFYLSPTVCCCVYTMHSCWAVCYPEPRPIGMGPLID